MQVEIIKASKRLFKGMPVEHRRAVLNLIINAQGAKLPMGKYGRLWAVENFGSPNMGERNLLPLIFIQAVDQHI
jgi:hypothetical protein